jgi:hypothetical protein
MSDTILLATFCQSRKIQETLENIKDNFDILGDKVFLLQDKSNKHKKILTYNVMKRENMVFSDIITNTISLHRKKETNTLYTLNALNEVVRSQNLGEISKDFSVDWESYRNTLLITYHDESKNASVLKIINTNLIKIINI